MLRQPFCSPTLINLFTNWFCSDIFCSYSAVITSELKIFLKFMAKTIDRMKYFSICVPIIIRRICEYIWDVLCLRFTDGLKNIMWITWIPYLIRLTNFVKWLIFLASLLWNIVKLRKFHIFHEKPSFQIIVIISWKFRGIKLRKRFFCKRWMTQIWYSIEKV